MVKLKKKKKKSQELGIPAYGCSVEKLPAEKQSSEHSLQGTVINGMGGKIF